MLLLWNSKIGILGLRKVAVNILFKFLMENLTIPLQLLINSDLVEFTFMLIFMYL